MDAIAEIHGALHSFKAPSLCKRKGRPPLWSESWRKRLVMLRLCGMELKEILEIISCLNESLAVSEKNQARRPQQIIREVLHGESPNEHSKGMFTVKDRVNLLRSIKSPPAERNQESLSIAPFLAAGHGMASSNDATEYAYSASFDYLEGLATQDEPPLEWPIIRRQALRRLLRHQGRTSSLISGIVSLLSKFTLLETEQEEKPELPVTPMLPTLDKEVARTRAFQSSQTTSANSAILESCCSQEIDCLHRALMEDRLPSSLEPFRNQVNELDTFGNNFLFFAARAGRSYEVLRRIIAVTSDLNILNDDRQTFLFVLDPEGFVKGEGGPRAHVGRIAEFLRLLRSRGYNFAQFDNEGRSFLTLLTMHPNFDLHWLTAMNDQDWDLCQSLKIISTQMDCKVAFLLDYVCHCLPNEVATESALTTIVGGFIEPPQTDSNRKQLPESRPKSVLSSVPISLGALPPKVQLGRLPNPRGGGLPRQLYRAAEVVDRVFDVYGYDGMTFLQRDLLAVLQQNADVDFSEYDQNLINFNARSFDGRTVLHFSTMYNRPDILRGILAVGGWNIRVNDRDEAGFSALDYAVNHFNQSRRPEGTAQTLANALNCCMALVDYGANMTFVPDAGNGERYHTALGRSFVIPATEPIPQELYT